MPLDESVNENEEIKSFVEKKRNGEGFSTIRKELTSRGYSEDKVAFMMREIEDLVLESHQKKKFGVPPIMIVGFIMGAIGILLIVIGIRGILSFVLISSGVAMIAVRRTNKGGNIERSKWNRR